MDEPCGGRAPASLAELAASLEAARTSGAAVVGIDGRSGAGKTALAGRLAAALPRTRVLHLDDAYRGWWGLSRGLDHVVTFVLAPLGRGEAGRFRPWDWSAGRPRDWVEVPPLEAGDLLLVEGCGAIAAPVDSYVDLGVWCRAPEDVRHGRAMARDDWGWAEHWERWARQEESLLRRREPDLCWDGA